MNQLREPGKEFNTYQLRLKLFTIQREKNTSQAQADTFKPATLLAQLLSTQQHYLPQLPPIKPSKLQLPLHQLIKLLVVAVVLVHTRLVDIQLADMLPELVQARFLVAQLQVIKLAPILLVDIQPVDMLLELVQEIFLVDQPQEQLSIQPQLLEVKVLLQEPMELDQIMPTHQEDH